ncbi:MAG: hypothetical protein MH137_11250 [Flavobacteriales bacterium]|nr:hypothetical protein [Flavobacteriales bacterium]
MINVRELPVSIKQVYIGNKRLTKSIFKQIESRSAFDKDLNFLGSEILGYVLDDKTKFLIFVNEKGDLCKSKLDNLIFTKNIPLNTKEFSLRTKDVFELLDVSFSEDPIFERLGKLLISKEGRERLTMLSKKAKDIFSVIENNKLYL